MSRKRFCCHLSVDIWHILSESTLVLFLGSSPSIDIMADLVSAECAKHLTVHMWISDMLGSVFYKMEGLFCPMLLLRETHWTTNLASRERGYARTIAQSEIVVRRFPNRKHSICDDEHNCRLSQIPIVECLSKYRRWWRRGKSRLNKRCETKRAPSPRTQNGLFDRSMLRSNGRQDIVEQSTNSRPKVRAATKEALIRVWWQGLIVTMTILLWAVRSRAWKRLDPSAGLGWCWCRLSSHEAFSSWIRISKIALSGVLMTSF